MMVAIVLMSHKMITASVKKVQQNINDSICPYMGMYICRDLGSIFVGICWCIYVCIYAINVCHERKATFNLCMLRY